MRLAMAITPDRAADVCDEATRALLEDRFEVRWGSAALDAAELVRLADGAEVMVTSWGTPPIPPELFTPAHDLRIVAHAAGTVKRLVPVELLGDRLTVFSAATRIAWSVGEYCLAACLALHRRLPAYDARTRAGGWKPDDFRGRELRGRTVGLIGGSSTARAFRSLLVPFGVRVLLYDPYLDQELARELDVTRAELAEVLTADIVSVHVPDLPATRGMITADLLARMPDGGVLINSARAGAVDRAALEREVLSGRLQAALDVFDPEPARLSPELAAAPNVLLTPHIAGDSVEGHLALVRYVLDDVLAFLADGARGPSWVDPSRWAVLA